MRKKWWWLLGLLWALNSWAGEPQDTIQRLSGFRQLDLPRLLAGEILTARGAMMDFPNGISAQTCFAVERPAAEVVRRLPRWDPTSHPELKVLVFQALPQPCHPADFAALRLDSPVRSLRWLLDKTRATTSTKSVFNLAQREAAELASGRSATAQPQGAAAAWAQLLAARGVAFQRQGWEGVGPYEVAGKPTSAVMQLRALLRDQAELALEFAPLLQKTGLMGAAADTALVPFYYWSCFEANHHATVCLGAVFQTAVGARYQIADVEYYVSGEYYAAVTLYEVLPVAGGTLVWRVDLFAAPMLEYTKGVERLAYEALMVQDIKQETRFMLNDFKVQR